MLSLPDHTIQYLEKQSLVDIVMYFYQSAVWGALLSRPNSTRSLMWAILYDQWKRAIRYGAIFDVLHEDLIVWAILS